MLTFNIGRDASNQIMLNDTLVSRNHAQLIVMDNGQVMIKDLGSSNGTFVNGNRITECYLNTGDVVKCGATFINWSQYAHNNAVESQVDLVSVANKAQEWNTILISFIKPFLTTIDNGSFFRRVFGWIYFTIAIINILLPFYIFFVSIDKGIFKEEGKFVLTFLVLWVVLTLLCWFGFQLWWNRREKVNQSSYTGAEFVATPVLAHFIQTIGEWYGVITGVLGFFMGLFALLFSDRSNISYYEYRNFDDSFMPIPLFNELDWKLIFLAPLSGFLIVFIFRFVSEGIKALSVIANNTKNNP